MKVHEVFLDLYPEIERHILRLKAFTVIDMVYELLNGYRDDLNKVCCSNRDNLGKCIVDCNIDEIKNILHEFKDEIKNDEFSSQDFPINCVFNINDIYDDMFLTDLHESSLSRYRIELTSAGSIKEDLINLLNDHSIRRGLCNSVDMSSNIPSMISSSVSFIANLIKDIIVMSQSYSLYNVSNHNKFDTHRSSKHPLWFSLYRYFIKRYIMCSNDNLSHKINILAAAHQHGLLLSYLLTYLLIKEKNIDDYLDFNELMRIYRELYFRYSSKEIIRSILNLSLKFNKLFQENKSSKVDPVISTIVDYVINKDKDKVETLYQSVCEGFRNIGLRKEDVEPLCYIVKLLRSILLFRKLASTVLRSSPYLYNQNALPYLLLYTLMTVSGIQYLWLVVPSVKLELKLPQEDLMPKGEHEVDVLLLGFLPEVDVNGVRFTPSIAALEIKLIDISQKCYSKKDDDQKCRICMEQLLSDHQLNFINKFNNDVCRNHKLSDIKCLAGVAIPCGDSMFRDVVCGIPFVCLEDLVSMGRFLVSLNELFYTFYSTNNSKQFSTPLPTLGL
ncbi:MAG: hypothetical protein QW215_01775 [Ignisphaera sp.]